MESQLLAHLPDEIVHLIMANYQAALRKRMMLREFCRLPICKWRIGVRIEKYNLEFGRYTIPFPSLESGRHYFDERLVLLDETCAYYELALWNNGAIDRIARKCSQSSDWSNETELIVHYS